MKQTKRGRVLLKIWYPDGCISESESRENHSAGNEWIGHLENFRRRIDEAIEAARAETNQ
jgi:hypothetical protein